ncbi:SusC/RagA family TonB-linked outer membrane protein [Chitinophaga sp. 30R24]|uniref:SusC/RagA family TonB-linked outer membrane protein n=1 Tax=Chitinophaga sp. 30R24 TaxID=3248838 RepID=UPI003B8F45AC
MKQFRHLSLSGRSALLLLCFLACYALSSGQSKTVPGKVSTTDGLQTGPVSGIITAADGHPVPGATVQVKGTANGALSDVNGKFILTLPSGNATLIISMMGFTPVTLNVKAGDQLKITLEKSLKELDEVLVVAYGTQKKGSVVGSVSQISGAELKKAPAMNITNMLAGRLPGISALQQSGRPGADDATLRIRGVGTYGANQGPLIIIDNVQRPSFANLSPDEIESITVLKDAVSTAVYGLQAANGIILITTKHGKNNKPTITYDGSVIFNSNTRFPKFLNGPDYMTWYNKGVDMDNDYLSHTSGDPVPYIYSQAQIDAVKNGTNTNPLLGNTNWVGELMGKTSMSQNHSLSINGGTDKVRYFVSGGYLDQEGVVNNTNFKRYNVRSNLDAALNEWLSVGADLGMNQQLSATPGIAPDNTAYMNPFYQAVRMLPNLPMYTPDGIPTAYQSGAGWVNPLAAVDRSGFQNGQTNVFQGNLNIKLKVPGVKGLDLKLVTAYDKSSTENKSWLTPYTLMGRNRDQVTGNFTVINTLPGITKTTLRQSYSTYNRKTFQPSISYSNHFGDHGFNALVLYEWSQQKSNVFSTGASNFALTDLKDINYGSTATEDFIAPTGSSKIDDSRAGAVARINYNYKDKYLVELASRYDASVNFIKSNRWKLFPAIGAGWVISKEPFFDNLSKVVNYLKLKGSVGRLGNGAASSFAYMQTFQLTSAPVVVIGGKPVSALYTSAPPNVNLRWETSTLYNGGFESIFLNDLLSLDFEWFYKLTNDILDDPGTLYPLSLGGYAPASLNYGIVDNRGFDLQIRHRNTIGKLQYGVTANMNWAKNKIIRMNESPGLPQWQRRVGRSIGDKMGFVVDGMYQTWEEAANGSSPSSGTLAPGFFKYRDLNGDGRITRADDMTFVGHSNMPQLTYGLNIDLKYGAFDFSALFQGAAIADISLAGAYEGSSGTSGVEDNTPFTKTFYNYGNSPYYLVEDSWTPDHPNAKYPRLSAYKAPLSAHNANANSGWIRDASYLRLKSVQLGYTLPKRWLAGAKIQQMRFYVSGFNLITWDKLKYLDPEMPNVNNGFYPQQKMYSGGASITF